MLKITDARVIVTCPRRNFVTLKITTDVPPGVCCSLKGAWMKTSHNGQTVSALAPGQHADICGGACYNDCRVEVAAF